jgi:hypothetical protein
MIAEFGVLNKTLQLSNAIFQGNRKYNSKIHMKLQKEN